MSSEIEPTQASFLKIIKQRATLPNQQMHDLQSNDRILCNP